MVYANQRTHFGMLPQAQLLDYAIASTAFVGAAMQVTSADYRQLGVAAIGAILGGLVAAGRFRKKEKTPLLEMWGVSTLSSIAFSPALFEWLSSPKLSQQGEVLSAAFVSATPAALLGVSAFVALCSWGVLAVIYYGSQRITDAWMKRKGGLDE